MSRKNNNGLMKNVLELIENENIIERDIIPEIEEASLNYAVKTIIDRALPDVRDGLKPAQRRILYAMIHYLGLKPNSKFMKSARVSGEVMGKLHPHGSSYGVAVNMANEFSIRYPVIDPQGNFGFPLDGDGPAAERYTEMRLSKLGMEMVKDVEKKVVEFKPTYDEDDVEPVVLPAAFPFLLVNGVSGIATGYTTDIPSHNLKEIVTALIELIKNPNLTTRDLMKYVKGPDLETGGYLIQDDQIYQLYETGKASLKFRAKIIKEETEDGGVNLVITELPPDLKKGSSDSSSGIVEKLYNLCVVDKKIPRIVDVRDESSSKRDPKTGKFIGSPVRIVIELHKTAVPDVIIDALYKMTSLEKTKGYLMRAVVNQAPQQLSLKSMMNHYIDHRKEITLNKKKFELRQAKKKLHLAEGFKKIFDYLDDVIHTIRNSEEPDVELKNKYQLSDEQVSAVLDMKLRKLSKLEEDKLDIDIANLTEEINGLEYVIANQVEIDNIIIKDLEEISELYGDERKTVVLSESDIEKITSFSDEPMISILTNKNNIKQIPESAYEDMLKSGALRERQEIYTQAVRCKTSDEFILFTNTGEYVKVNFSDLVGTLNFLEDKTIVNFIVLDSKDENKNVIVMTKKGMIKKSTMQSFRARARRLAPYINLSEDDRVIGVKVTDSDEKNTIVLSTNKGTVHRFYEKAFSSSNPGGNGVPCISPSVIEEGEYIADFAILNEEKESQSLLVLYIKKEDKYYEKSMSMDDFRTKGRVSKGIVGAGNDLDGEVFRIKVTDSDFIIIDTKGLVYKQKFVSIPIQNRYNRPNESSVETLITEFFI